MKSFILERYSEGVLDEFVEPFVKAFFADTSANISALSGLRIISSSFVTYELDGGYYPLVQALESRLNGMIAKGSKVLRVEPRPDKRFSLEREVGSDEADIVVCCVPVPDLKELVSGITYPEVNYVSKMAFGIKGRNKFPEVAELINGDDEYHTDVIHFRGGLATLSSVRDDPDLGAFFESPKVLAAHKWQYCSPRARPGATPPRFETEIPNLFKSGDLIYGGGLESSSRAGIESAQLVMRCITAA